jgi:hypothetical protein
MADIDPFKPIVLYRSADIADAPIEDDLPIFRHDHDQLLEQCVRAVARREELYPSLVAAGRMDDVLAEVDLGGWRALVAEWRWIITGEGQRPTLDTLADRVAAVELATERLDGELARGRCSQANLYQRHLLEALAWHLRPERRTHFYAELTRTMRADLRAQSERNAA